MESLSYTLNQSDRRQLRRQLRRKRRSLSPARQREASLRLARNLLRHPRVQRSRHIALYLANDGEIDPGVFIALARQHGKTCYLPILHPVYHNRLWFARFDRDTPLQPNRMGIPEPPIRGNRRRAPWALDLVLMPLVGFDPAGNRLGMGGGFYDRTFAFRQRHQGPPALLGLAHEVQKVDALPIQHWDVTLDGVVTDGGFYGAGRFAPQAPVTGSMPTSYFSSRYRLHRSRFNKKHRPGY